MQANNSKPWWSSKTIWLNLVGAIAVVVQAATDFVIDPEAQVGILALANIIVRAVTKQAIRSFLILSLLPASMALHGCGAVRGFVEDNPLLVDAGTAVACQQAACRITNDFDREVLANQLSSCGQIVAAGCEGEQAPVARSGRPAPNELTFEIPQSSE